jgi:hypothetical protein
VLLRTTTILSYVTLVDAAAESRISHSVFRSWLEAALIGYLLFSVGIIKLSGRWSWARQGAGSLIVLIAL